MKEEEGSDGNPSAPCSLCEYFVCHARVRRAQGHEVGVNVNDYVCMEKKMGRGVSRVHGVSVRLADRSSAPETNPCMNKSITSCLCVCLCVCV